MNTLNLGKYVRVLAATLLLTAFSSPHPAAAQVTAPVIAGDFADPSIIKAGNEYYAIGTSSEWAPHYPVYRSGDLKDWKQTGFVFQTAPAWTSGSFWAPEYFYHNSTYYIYYTARRKSDNVSCIGVATSSYPDRDFKDQGVVVAYGKEAIDAFVFDDNGQLYITFKAYGLDDRPIEILGSKLRADGLKMEGDVFTLLKDDDRTGMEGQCLLQKDGSYYLLYSVGSCCGRACSYHVNVAKAATITGPYEKRGGTPLLTETADWKCPGHGTYVNTQSDGYYYLYHAYNKTSDVFTGRQGMLAKLSFAQTKWPVLTPVPTQRRTSSNISDTFSGASPALYWQYDFRNATPKVVQRQGKLLLSGDVKASNPAGIALAVRPASDVFTLEATVANVNDALKGLVLYGDANAAVGVGVANNKVEVWMVKDNKRSVLGSALLAAAPVKLRLVTFADHTCKAFYQQQTNEWTEILTASPVSIVFLPQWDRSPRPGLHFQGTATADAQFDDFAIRY